MRYIVVLLILICASAQAQVLTKFYYNKHWELTTKDSAVYVRTCTYDSSAGFFQGAITDSYANGNPQMKGTIVNKQKEGDFTFYYPNGQIESTGKYAKNQRAGQWTYYYANGQEKLIAIFGTNNFRRITSMKDSTGASMMENGTGKYYEAYELYRVPEKIIVTGNFKNFVKDGTWECYLSSKKKLYTEKYSKGKFTKGTIYPDGVNGMEGYEAHDNILEPPYKFVITEEIVGAKGIDFDDYPVLKWMQKDGTMSFSDKYYGSGPGNERMQAPAGSFMVVDSVIGEVPKPDVKMSVIYDEIRKELKWPAEAKQAKQQGDGRAFVVVKEDGSIGDVTIAESTGFPLLDAEALRALKAVVLRHKWKPAMLKDKPVIHTLQFPFSFKLAVRK